MATDTTNYLLKKPTVGGDDDLWGGYINDNMDSIDTQMKSNADTAAAALPKAGGTMTGDIAHGDNVKAKFGASDDLQIYSDGTNGVISEQGPGDLKILATYVNARNAADTATLWSAAQGGAFSAHYNGSAKLATTSTGVDVTGTVTATGAFVNGGTGFGQFELGGDSGGYIDLKKPNSDDYDARIIYSGSAFDLHTNADEAIRLRHNNSTKLATSSSGVDVTGTVTADGFAVGVALKSWDAAWAPLQIGDAGSLSSRSSGVSSSTRTFLTDNAYNNGSSHLSTWKYINADQASQYVQMDGHHKFRSAASGTADGTITWTENVWIDSGGHILAGNGVTLGNGTTYAASNTLDDYEEGTFTPTLGAVTVTYDARVGEYVKIGDTVHCYISIDTATLDTADASGIHLSALPFAVSRVIGLTMDTKNSTMITNKANVLGARSLGGTTILLTDNGGDYTYSDGTLSGGVITLGLTYLV